MRLGRRPGIATPALAIDHEILIVAPALAESTKRIASDLNDRDIAINLPFFQVCAHGIDRLLSRA